MRRPCCCFGTDKRGRGIRDIRSLGYVAVRWWFCLFIPNLGHPSRLLLA